VTLPSCPAAAALLALLPLLTMLLLSLPVGRLEEGVYSGCHTVGASSCRLLLPVLSVASA
jgi:hypothetical protein